jgi:hypothetical protein
VTPELEIYAGWDREHAFIVMQWDRHRDSRQCLRGFSDRTEAIAFAEGISWATRWPLITAEVLSFERRASA